MRKLVIFGLVMLVLGAFLSGFLFDHFITPPIRVSVDTVKYCTQVYYGNVPVWARAYVPDPNGTYRVYVCRVY